MSKTSVRTQIGQRRTIESLHKALDQTYQQLVEAAKADWERLFIVDEASDTCVTVRLSKEQIADELAGIPRVWFNAGRLRPGIEQPASRAPGLTGASTKGRRPASPLRRDNRGSA